MKFVGNYIARAPEDFATVEIRVVTEVKTRTFDFDLKNIVLDPPSGG